MPGKTVRTHFVPTFEKDPAVHDFGANTARRRVIGCVGIFVNFIGYNLSTQLAVGVITCGDRVHQIMNGFVVCVVYSSFVLFGSPIGISKLSPYKTDLEFVAYEFVAFIWSVRRHVYRSLL